MTTHPGASVHAAVEPTAATDTLPDHGSGWRTTARTHNFSGMGMLYEYFAAPSDEVAVMAGFRSPHTADGGDWDAIAGGAIEPSVNLIELEELLTGVAYDDIVEDPRSGTTLASIDDRGMVIAVTEALRRALATVNPDRLFAVAGEWSHAEEFGGVVSPGDLARFLTDLAALARRASAKNEKLYCWVTF